MESFVPNYDKYLGLTQPSDDENIFEFGESSRMAAPWWKINKLQEHARIDTSHNNSDLINDMLICDQGNIAITCSNDKSIKITNLKNSKESLSINLAHLDAVLRIKLQQNNTIASAGKDGLIKIWNIRNGTNITTIQGHNQWIWGLDEIPGEALVSISDDHTMKFWSINDRLCYKTIRSPQGKSIRCLKVQSNTQLVFASFRIWVYSTQRDEIEKHFVGHSNYVRSVVYIKSRNYLISGGEDFSQRFWNWDTCNNFKSINVHCQLLTLDLWEDQFIVGGTADCKIHFFDLGLSRLVTSYKCKIFPTQIKTLPDSSIVYTEYNSIVVLKNPFFEIKK